MENPPLFHWLLAGQVVTKDQHGKERQKGFNTLTVTEKSFLGRIDLAKAQDAMMRRSVTETVQVKGTKIVDVFIQSVSLLGHVTRAEFNEGFEEENSQNPVRLNS